MFVEQFYFVLWRYVVTYLSNVLENFRNVFQRFVSRRDRGDPVQIDQKPEAPQAGIENPQ